MTEQIHIEAQIEIQKNDIASIKDMLVKMDQKFDGMQNFMNKLYEVFVTQKELQKLDTQNTRDHEEMWSAIKDADRGLSKLTIRASVITGIGVTIVFLKDILLDALFKNFK